MPNKKDRRVALRLTSHEFLILKSHAAAQTTTLSQLLRELIQAYNLSREVLL